MTHDWLYWNPNPVAFTVPILEHPVRWYGVLFAIGFLFGYLIIQQMFSRQLSSHDQPTGLSREWADKILWYTVLGTLVGARLGHVVFYEWDRFYQNPSEILWIWHGGLASHGGTIGVIIAAWLFVRAARKQQAWFTYRHLLDTLAFPTALVAVFIRLGNFCNQEIIGQQTAVPWAVIFGSPFESSIVVPRHPTQLYEAASYLAIFGILGVLWRRKPDWIGTGLTSGLFLVLVFGARFLIEPFKQLHEDPWIIESLTRGQLLSIPFVLAGVVLLRQAIYAVRTLCITRA